MNDVSSFVAAKTLLTSETFLKGLQSFYSLNFVTFFLGSTKGPKNIKITPFHTQKRLEISPKINFPSCLTIAGPFPLEARKPFGIIS